MENDGKEAPGKRDDANQGPRALTELLRGVEGKDPQASEKLLPLVYGELRELARRRMARERAGHTLQPTALVHEAYLRLVGDESGHWDNRGHFFAAAATAMRRILVERARRQARLKRGGDRVRVTFDEGFPGLQSGGDEILAVDEALDRLKERDEVMAEVVELRYFAGLTVEETARFLDLSPRTINRNWTAARAWLYRELKASDA